MDVEERIRAFEKAEDRLRRAALRTDDVALRKRICWKMYYCALIQVWIWNGSYRREP